MVLPSLLYACETWTLYRRHIKKLELFHMRALCSILGIRWQDHITNLEVLDQAKSTSIEANIIKAQLRWVGHVIWMEECRLLRRLIYGELQAGKEIKVDQNCGIKTRWKPISSGATSIRETWRDMPWTDQNGQTNNTNTHIQSIHSLSLFLSLSLSLSLFLSLLSPHTQKSIF